MPSDPASRPSAAAEWRSRRRMNLARASTGCFLDSYMKSALFGRIQYRFDPVAVRVENECRIVVRTIVRPKSRSAVVPAAVRERSAVEVGDGFPARSRKRQVKSRPGHRGRRSADLDRELVAASRMAISDRGLVGPYPDVAERRERRVVEGGGTVQVRDRKGNMVLYGEVIGCTRFRSAPISRLLRPDHLVD